MINFRKGEMWEQYSKDVLFVVTTNSYIKTNGKLVMGRGIALEAKRRCVGLATVAGREIVETCGHLGSYGFLFIERYPIGLFQTKRHYANQTSMETLEYSFWSLQAFLLEFSIQVPIHINYPAIGLGGLSKSIVSSFLKKHLAAFDVNVWSR